MLKINTCRRKFNVLDTFDRECNVLDKASGCSRLGAYNAMVWRSESFIARVACVFLAATLTGCGMSNGPPGVAAPLATGKAPGTPASAESAQALNEYIIGPGDVLSIFVYQSPSLSVTELPVRPDGRISVPLVADVMAAERTPTQLGAEIAAKLKKYVNDPNVTVMVRSFQGPLARQVRVIGAATDPQAIPYRENMSVMDVMIATRGLTKFAAGNRAVIVRKEGGNERRLHVRLTDLLNGDTTQDVPMQPGDTLIIPESYF